MSAIEDAARRLVEVFAVRDLEATADAMHYLSRVVREAGGRMRRLDAFWESIHATLEAEHLRQEADCVKALGRWARIPKWSRRFIIPRLGFEVVYQEYNESEPSRYRGIRRHGRWVIDNWSAK